MNTYHRGIFLSDISHCCFFNSFSQLQKHDQEDEEVPAKWRSEEEMAAEASDLRKQLEES